MKTNQLLGVIGGVLLLAVTLIPQNGHVMWEAVSVITYVPKYGLFPIILAAAGIIGALMAKQGKGMVALACGAVALLYALIVSEFNFAMFQDLHGILMLLGSVLLIVSGVMKSK